MQPGKILTMPTPIRPSVPEIVPSETASPALGPGPISPSDIRALYMVLDIQRALGGVERAVKVLESTAKTHGEKLEHVDKMQSALSILERSNVFHGQRLGEVEKDLYAAKIITGIVAVGAALTTVVIFLIHRLGPFFSR